MVGDFLMRTFIIRAFSGFFIMLKIYYKNKIIKKIPTKFLW